MIELQIAGSPWETIRVAKTELLKSMKEDFINSYPIAERQMIADIMAAINN